MSVALTLFLAAVAAAQSPMPSYGDAPPASPAPAASSATAVSTATAPAEPPPPPPPTPKPAGPARVLRATIHKEAKEWEPVSLRAGGETSATAATLRQVKSKGRTKGQPSKAVAVARARRVKDATVLTIAVFPKALEKSRTHIEVRFRIVEGFVEGLETAAVTVPVSVEMPPGRPDLGELRRLGVEFSEEGPASGEVLVSSLDPRVGKSSFNAGELRLASFAARELGFTTVSWAVAGVEGPAPKR